MKCSDSVRQCQSLILMFLNQSRVCQDGSLRSKRAASGCYSTWTWPHTMFVQHWKDIYPVVMIWPRIYRSPDKCIFTWLSGEVRGGGVLARRNTWKKCWPLAPKIVSLLWSSMKPFSWVFFFFFQFFFFFRKEIKMGWNIPDACSMKCCLL